MCEISVIIPVYNKKEYLRDTIEAVLSQTFCDYELLLIDDGSTDGSDSICNELSDTDNRIKVFHTKNRGVSAARNFGIRKATGKYISFIDADDYIENTFLEKLCQAMENDSADMAVCGYYEIRSGKRIDRELEKSDTGNELFDVIRYNLLCVIWNKLFVKKKIRHFFDESLTLCEDSLFCAKYYSDNRPKIAYVYENLYGYLRHREGLTGSLREGALNGIKKFYDFNRYFAGNIWDKQLKRLAIHHIYTVYYYGIYAFIFENICEAPMNEETLSVISDIINDARYRRIVKHILIFTMYDRRAEKPTFKEFLYIVFSLLKMKRAIYILAKVKKCLEPYKNRL